MRRSLGCTGTCFRGLWVSVKAGLPPIAPANARLFVLGSLPGDASLAARQYYAHPTNQFWRLLGGAIGEELHELFYDERVMRLAERRIGLWDVIAAGSRYGRLDQAIGLTEHNKLERLLPRYPDLRAIALNGAPAAAIGRKLIGQPPPHLTLVDLPSSSAANTTPLAGKAQAWARLGQFLRP